jgi:hypothetical protein
MSKIISFKPEPNAIWVATDVDCDIEFKPGSVPKTAQQLVEFADKFNQFVVDKKGSWVTYAWFDDGGKLIGSMEFEFAI